MFIPAHGKPYSKRNATACWLMLAGTMLAIGGMKLAERVIPVQAEQPKIESFTLPSAYKWSVPELLHFYAGKYKVSESYMQCIVFQESGGNAYSLGDHGLAVGVVQFHLDTWKWFRKLQGKIGKDERANPVEALDTFAWALSKGLDRNWSPVINGVCSK